MGYTWAHLTKPPAGADQGERLTARTGTSLQIMKWPRRAPGLPAILLAFFLLSLVYNAATPPFEGPDEAQHFAYILWLAEGKGFPPQGDEAWLTAMAQEAGQPPLYYGLAALLIQFVDWHDPPATYRPNPYYTAPLPRSEFDNDNRAIPYPADGRLSGGWLALTLARGLSLAAGLLLLVGVYGLVRTVWSEPALAFWATLLVAATPQVLFISNVASNDMPAAAAGAWTLWLLARLLRGGGGRLALATGIVFGVGLLFKVGNLALALPLAAGLLGLWLTRQSGLPSLLRSAFWMGAGALLTAGPWFGRVWILYGSPLGIDTHNAAPWAIRADNPILPAGTRWLEVSRTYWLAFGWGTIRPPGWVYTILWGLTGLALAGLCLGLWRSRAQGRRKGVAPLLLAVLALTLLGVALSLEVWMQRVVAPHGRLLFPAIGALAFFLVLGWWQLHPKLTAPAVGAIIVLALAAPFWLLRPAMTPPPLLTATEVDARLTEAAGAGTVLHWFYGESAAAPIAELLTVHPATRSVVATTGTVLPVTVCWRALAPAAIDYTVLLHVVGPEDGLVGQRGSYPGQGLRPTSQWPAGAVFCDVMHVALREPAQALVYQLELVLFDPATDQRLPAFDQAGNGLSPTFAAPVRLVPPATTFAAAADIRETVFLSDYELPARQWQPGGVYEFALTWEMGAAVNVDAQVFVHLLDPATGERVAQADGPPLNGWYPTSWWAAGERVRDERRFALPAGTVPGNYELQVGLYRLATGERLSDPFSLGEIEVAP